MKYVPLYDHELKWLIRHVNFQGNMKLYQRLVSYIRQEECIITNMAYIINTVNEDKPQIVESYALHNDTGKGDGALLGFHTSEQYFTDPGSKKIHFSEKGFIFYTDGKDIYLINRENGRSDKTGYDHVKSGESLLDIRKSVAFLKIQDEYFWPMTDKEKSEQREIEEARIKLDAKPDEEVCPKCKDAILLVSDSSEGSRSFYCPACELGLRKEPHGWVIG